MEDIDKYKRGFNMGYLYKKHQPELYESIARTNHNKNEYLQGFQDGGIQYGKELLKSKKREGRHTEIESKKKWDLEK